MTLWLRLIWLLLTAFRRGHISDPLAATKLRLRVLPNDIDISLHMNNGRYVTVMDLGRIDLIIRSRIWRAVLRHRWTPIASAVTIRFRREIRSFETYDLSTRIICWTETHLFMEQVFTFAQGRNAGDVAARALVRGAFYDRKARAYVPVTRILDEVGVASESPPMPPEVAAFAASDEALRRTVSAEETVRV